MEALARGKGCQDVAHGVGSGGGGADAEAQAGQVVPPEAGLDVVDPAVSAGTTSGAQAQPAKGEGEVVVDEEEVAGGVVEGEGVEGAFDGATGEVHEGFRYEQGDGGARHVSAGELPEEFGLGGEVEAVPGGEALDQQLARIVSAASIFGAGVAEAHDELHVRPGLAGLAPRRGLFGAGRLGGGFLFFGGLDHGRGDHVYGPEIGVDGEFDAGRYGQVPDV